MDVVKIHEYLDAYYTYLRIRDRFDEEMKALWPALNSAEQEHVRNIIEDRLKMRSE